MYFKPCNNHSLIEAATAAAAAANKYYFTDVLCCVEMIVILEQINQKLFLYLYTLWMFYKV